MNEENSARIENVSTGEPPKARAQRLAAHFAMPPSGPDTLVKIIKGYAVASNGGANPVNYKDVASATGLGPSVVSRNNSFLSESQIISSPKYGFFIPSESAVKFARESAWDEPNSKSHLRSAVARTWFYEVVNQNFTTRPVLTRDNLKRVLAIKSGATEGDAESLGRLIDFISYLGLIAEGEDGNFTRGQTAGIAQDLTPTSHIRDGQQAVSADVARTEYAAYAPNEAEKTASVAKVVGRGAVFQINLNININSVSELTLKDADALRAWMNRVLSETEEEGMPE